MLTKISAKPLTQTRWAAIGSLFMGVTSLIAAEFIPVSLLTSIAGDLNISEGQAGQSVTMVGVAAVFTSLLLAPLTRSINRRLILLTFSILLVASNILVALAPNYGVLLIGRAILGLCVGGFWAMASAVVLQLAVTKDVARALSVVYAGVSVATIIALPLASYLGPLIGWRNLFLIAAALAVIALIWQVVTLPSLAPRTGNDFSAMLALLKQNWVLMGIMGTVLSYGGYHLFFTYLRPFLELNLTLTNQSLSMVLLSYGISNCVGTLLAGWLLTRYFRCCMVSVHFVLACLALLLLLDQDQVIIDSILVILWGLIFGFITVGWSTWITRTLHEQAELAGGLSVAAIQFAIGLAAGIGGVIFDHSGISGIFMMAAVIGLGGALVTLRCLALYQQATGRAA